MGDGDTLVNALVGAVVSVVAGGTIPFGPLFGGAVAGYLQGGDRSDGTRIGLIAGLVALVPTLLIGAAVFWLFGLFTVGVGSGGVGFGLFGLAVVLFAFVTSAVYVVGLSVAGGWLGNYVRYDTDVDF